MTKTEPLMEEENIKWVEITCPICLDSPHNSVLLQCSSYQKGCRPFVCDTNHLHSNCLERFKEANGVFPSPKSLQQNLEERPQCPLCRGDVMGWAVIDKARKFLDSINRRCEVDKCLFSGTYSELQKHVIAKHPNARPCKVDEARKVDWENMQSSADRIEVMSTIHSEHPNGVVIGDYVIEYEDFEDFRRINSKRNLISSCVLYTFFRVYRRYRRKKIQRIVNNRRALNNNNDLQ